MTVIREKFLLHTCCAPCGIAVIFYNPNIYPETEYIKRKTEVIRVCKEWGVSIIDQDYEPETWEKAIRGLEGEPEGGARCGVCFRERLFHTAKVAAELGIKFFGSTLTTGRNKCAIIISPIGLAAGKRFGVAYLAEDWKKKGREERGRKMVRERGIYRQNYCGCKYSMRNVVEK
jgi:predicted adenine nucleotide alpha hydrolase (AANH) superfamily ATPase